jgi:hypothetical protein
MHRPKPQFKEWQVQEQRVQDLREGDRVYSNGTWGWVKNGKIEWDWSESLYTRAFGARRARRS